MTASIVSLSSHGGAGGSSIRPASFVVRRRRSALGGNSVVESSFQKSGVSSSSTDLIIPIGGKVAATTPRTDIQRSLHHRIMCTMDQHPPIPTLFSKTKSTDLLQQQQQQQGMPIQTQSLLSPAPPAPWDYNS